jgi:hypothetical protein
MTAALIPLCILGFIVLAFVDRAIEQAAQRREAGLRLHTLGPWRADGPDVLVTQHPSRAVQPRERDSGY